MEPQQKYVREIDIGDGAGVERFEADTLEELVDKIAEAKRNASMKIRQQERMLRTGFGLITPDKDEPVPQYKPRQLTADELFALTQDLQDPARAAQAVRTLVEAQLGAPLQRVGESLTAGEIQRRQERALEEANAFMEATHEYYPCPENRDALGAYLEKNQMACTRKNLELAFQELRDSGLLVAKPEPQRSMPQEPEPTERIAPQSVTRPRRTATSIRPGDSSSATVSQPRKITWEDINRMSPAVYDERMRDPEFRKLVDSLPR